MPTSAEYSLLPVSIEPREFRGLVTQFDSIATSLGLLAAMSTADGTALTAVTNCSAAILNQYHTLGGRSPGRALASWYSGQVSALATQANRLDVGVAGVAAMRLPPLFPW